MTFEHDSLRDYAEDTIGASRTGNAREYAADCPVCGKPDHLYINIETGLCHCFACGYGANLISLIQEVEGLSWNPAHQKATALLDGVAARETRRRVESLGGVRALLLSALNETPPARAEIETALALPKFYAPITDPFARQARDYLAQRGFNERHWSRYEVGFVTGRDPLEPRYYHHIIFVERDPAGNIVYFCSRAAFEPTTGQKSYHPRGASKSGLLFGADKLHAQKFVIVVEGPLDMLALGGCAVALLGKSMGEAQAVSLARLNRRVVICLDADAEKEALAAAEKLRACGAQDIWLSRCPWKDPTEGLKRERHSGFVLRGILVAAVKFGWKMRATARMKT